MRPTEQALVDNALNDFQASDATTSTLTVDALATKLEATSAFSGFASDYFKHQRLVNYCRKWKHAISNGMAVATLLAGTMIGATPVPASASVVQPLRIVSTGNRIGKSFVGPGSGTGRTMGRLVKLHLLAGDISSFAPLFVNWAINGSAGDDTQLGNDVTISKSWLIRVATNEVAPVTFAGARSMTMPANSTKAYFAADEIPASFWKTPLVYGEQFKSVTHFSLASDTMAVAAGPYATFAGEQWGYYAPANDPGTIDTAVVPTITGISTSVYGGNFILAGRFKTAGNISVASCFDSIGFSFNDGTNPVPKITGTAFIERALIDANGANPIAHIGMGYDGISASHLNDSTGALRRAMAALCNVYIDEMGTNDIGGTNSDGTAIQATIAKNWTQMRAAGIQKIVRTKLLPRTTSTDNWATVANQTITTGWAAGQTRDLLEAMWQTALGSGAIDYLCDIRSVIADTDQHYWKSYTTSGNGDQQTSDGTHPFGFTDTRGHGLMAPFLRATLLSIPKAGLL